MPQSHSRQLLNLPHIQLSSYNSSFLISGTGLGSSMDAHAQYVNPFIPMTYLKLETLCSSLFLRNFVLPARLEGSRVLILFYSGSIKVVSHEKSTLDYHFESGTIREMRIYLHRRRSTRAPLFLIIEARHVALQAHR